MSNMLSMLPVSLPADLCALPSFAWTNSSVAFAPDHLANLAWLVAVVTLVALAHVLLKLAVNLLEIRPRAPASNACDLSLTTVSASPGLDPPLGDKAEPTDSSHNIKKDRAPTLLELLNIRFEAPPSLLASASASRVLVPALASNACDLSLTTVSASPGFDSPLGDKAEPADPSHNVKKDRAPTLPEDAITAAESEVDEPEPPKEAEDHKVKDIFSLTPVPASPGSFSPRGDKVGPPDLCRTRVRWSPTVAFVSKKVRGQSFVRSTGFVNQEYRQMAYWNSEETQKIQAIFYRWWNRQYGLPDHLVARLSSNLLGYIYTVSSSSAAIDSDSDRLTFPSPPFPRSSTLWRMRSNSMSSAGRRSAFLLRTESGLFKTVKVPPTRPSPSFRSQPAPTPTMT